MSVEIPYATCRYCRKRQRVRLTTDGAGGLVQGPLPCGCNERRLAGICLDCPAPVEGRLRVALRCGPCKAQAQLRYSRRYRARHPERIQRANRKQDAKRRRHRRQKKAGEEIRARDRAYRRANRDRINANRRRRLKDPEARERHLAKRREWKTRNPELVKEIQDRANAKRRVDARQYMHDYATKHVGIDCEPPKCRTCGDAVPYDGRGRPRLDCPACREAA